MKYLPGAGTLVVQRFIWIESDKSVIVEEASPEQRLAPLACLIEVVQAFPMSSAVQGTVTGLLLLISGTK